MKHNLNWVDKKTKASFQFFWNLYPKDIEQTVRISVEITNAQLPRSVSMLIKLFQVFYYDFLVVLSLDLMLEVKSSQKLMVPSVPFIENVDISVKKQGFCNLYDHFTWVPHGEMCTISF